MNPPKIFTKSVAIGKLRWIYFIAATLDKYLKTAPKPPPIKTEIMFSIEKL